MHVGLLGENFITITPLAGSCLFGTAARMVDMSIAVLKFCLTLTTYWA